MVQLRTTCSIHDQSVWVAYCKSFGAAVQRQYAEAQKRCFERLFEEVKIARDNQASSFVAYSQPTDIRPGSPCEPTGAFTEEVVGILQEAFQRTATLSAAEVKGLRQITKLSTKQIRTWFANQRQRRGRKPAPYPVATSRRPSNQISPARRNFSDSSTSSSIISYTDSDASSAELPLDRNDVLPSPGDDPFLAFHQQRDRAQATEHLLPPQAYPHALALPSGLRDVHHLPPAPTTAETDRFFSSPPQQASEPIPASASFLDHLASSDPFLDDRFLDNIFGNLGVTANGGLTLTMESFQDEAESGVPMNDFEGGGGSNAGAFSFDW
ncbi:homeobox domain-containing protein [Sporobolomyces koalae]|uniref:homeobox domain-containing protein n=1 Tax=Sporobolomyces koalae TaxID=500713 RepID=UPI00316DF686